MPTQMINEELVRRVSAAASMVKLTTGVCNNAAWYTCLEAFDQVKQHKRYRGATKQAFKQVFTMFHQYERKLIYATENRMFHVDDLSPEYRKIYGNITDREYYDFWKASGVQAYQQSGQWLSNLQNKYRLSLMAHGVEGATIVAWAMTAQAALELAVESYESCIRTAVESTQQPQKKVELWFGQFSLEQIRKAWLRALYLLSPDGMVVDPPETEQRNIQHGIEQLHDAWMDPAVLYDSTIASIENYDEVFRTKGEMKKAMREIAEMRDDVVEEYKQQKQKHDQTTTT